MVRGHKLRGNGQMGFLLLQYEYQKSCANVNRYTRKNIRANDRLERITKSIEKVSTKYEKRRTKLESKYSKLQTQVNQEYSNKCSLASGGQLQNMSGTYGNVKASGVVTFINAAGQVVQSVLCSAGEETTADTKCTDANTIAAFKQTLQQQLQAIQDALDMEKEAMENAIDAEENDETEPLNDKETEYECEKNTTETLLTLWDERKEKAKERLASQVEGSMAHYGLS